MAGVVPDATRKIFTAETLRSFAKQSIPIHIVPVPLRKSIKKFLRAQDLTYMKRKVLRLAHSYNMIKMKNLQLVETTVKEMIDDPLKNHSFSKRWKVKTSYGDIGLKYEENETLAYIAARMPSVYCANYRVFTEIHRRLPDFIPTKVLDFGAGTSTVLWAMRDVWPCSVKKLNMVEPSKPMRRAGLAIIQGQKDLPLIQGYDSLLSLSINNKKKERDHDLVVSSHVLGEIPSVQDRITTIRQLWNFTTDLLVLIEPGTPHGANIISQARAHILWMEKRKLRKANKAAFNAGKNGLKNVVPRKSCGSFVVAPCSHDGTCPLRFGGPKYCHFVQRLRRTSTQRIYKRSRRGRPLMGYEDAKFSFVVLRKGQRPQHAWPLDGVVLDTLREKKRKRGPEYYIMEIDELTKSERPKVLTGKHLWESDINTTDADANVNTGNVSENANIEAIGGGAKEVAISENVKESAIVEHEVEGELQDEKEVYEEEDDEGPKTADLGTGWGRIIYMPICRGTHVHLDVCRSIDRRGLHGCFERVTLTKTKNPELHRQAKKSYWGDLWPY